MNEPVCDLCQLPATDHVAFHHEEPRDEANLVTATFNGSPWHGLYCPNGATQ